MNDDQVIDGFFELIKIIFVELYQIFAYIFNKIIIPLTKEFWEFAKEHPKFVILLVILAVIGGIIEALMEIRYYR